MKRERQQQILDGTWAEIQYPNGSYTGEIAWVNGKVHRKGKGTTLLFSGGLEDEKHEGYYHNDRREGIGLLMWGNGDVYVGDFKDDLMHGQGVYYYGTGATYAGGFALGQKTGDGRFTWHDGVTYVGQFYDGTRHGIGFMRKPSKKGHGMVRYLGDWQDNRKHGEGFYESESEGRYRGEFENDLFHGNGALALLNGDQYIGSFMFGKPQGSGHYKWASNHSKYAGEIDRGKLQGEGALTSKATGTIYTGQFSHSMPDGFGTMRNRSKRKEQYAGDWVGGFKSGVGTYEWQNGTRFEGRFSDDARHGDGAILFTDGAVWQGQVADDRRHGMATWQEGDTAMKERWHHGKLVERDEALVITTHPDVDDAASDENVAEAELDEEEQQQMLASMNAGDDAVQAQSARKQDLQAQLKQPARRRSTQLNFGTFKKSHDVLARMMV
eukprot:gnl/TRDRNA2_/TRDRNA2_171936_c0_seq2.p1 gnl/TRDRNA2_/TRDRNA2_171936_c0~~gnl/TRDRNA2_/TRDRNA2_171936_c0_seq2.p1  ORF type:complete len:513 (-),score=77.20 gnl/TRDRNA2_/TRDRNA2_171936_c0_seq2:61-1377(-)